MSRSLSAAASLAKRVPRQPGHLALLMGLVLGLNVVRLVQAATDVGSAVAGMTLTGGSWVDLTSGQQVKFQHIGGTTAGSYAPGLVVHDSETIQIDVQGSMD